MGSNEKVKLKFLIISFLGHSLGASLLIANFNLSKVIKSEVVEIEIKEIIKKKIKKNELASGNKLAKKGLLFFPKKIYEDLLSRVEENSRWAAKMNSLKQQKDFNDPRAYDSNIDEVFGENDNQNMSYYKEIYTRIDSNLTFDSVLAQYNHFGRVYVQFKTTEDGLLKIDEFKTESSDSILKVHVLRAIKKSLSNSIEIVKKLKIGNQTIFQAEFDFAYGDYKNNFYKQSNFGKPVFVFKRTTQEKPVPKELLEQLLSGGVTPNISLMFERWKKYNKNKHLEAIQFDPFESYRRDTFYTM